MQVEAPMALEPALDRRCLVGGVVVEVEGSLLWAFPSVDCHELVLCRAVLSRNRRSWLVQSGAYRSSGSPDMADKEEGRQVMQAPRV
mgnify:CR=1 FL=1